MPLRFPESASEWRLDAVGLLAVIGESSMTEQTQPLTASWLCTLPRLIPAPQALLKPSRPSGLPSKNAVIVGVHNGTTATELNYFANLLHPITELAPYTVSEITITHKTPSTRHPGAGAPEIHPRRLSPLSVLTVASTLLTVGLLAGSIIAHDGVAFVAVTTISAASTVVGLASLWQPQLTKRTLTSPVPLGDAVIRTRSGAFLVVHCTENVARELYFGTEGCSYFVGDQLFRAFMGLGTFLFMVAVGLMSNCTRVMQITIGVSYVLLNALYWVLALLPPAWHWDLDRYQVVVKSEVKLDTYTEALWQAIKASGNDESGEGKGRHCCTNWVRTTNAAPQSTAWNHWIREAEENMNAGNDNWNAIEGYQKCQMVEDAENGMLLHEAHRQTSFNASTTFDSDKS